MRRVKDIIESYDPSKKGDRKKIALIEWFQQHPGKRFDRNEVHTELAGQLNIGEKQIGNYLNELADDGVLKTYGSKRISYELANDVIVPINFQIRAAYWHIVAIFDVKRWGIAGFAVIFTVIWGIMTVPFWFFLISSTVLPGDSVGPLHQSDIFTMAIAMTFWLVIAVASATLLYQYHLWKS